MVLRLNQIKAIDKIFKIIPVAGIINANNIVSSENKIRIYQIVVIVRYIAIKLRIDQYSRVADEQSILNKRLPFA